MDSNQNITAIIASLPPGYLEEDHSSRLLHVAITFAVLEPIFFALFLAARFANKTLNGWDFWLMPISFVVVFAHVPIQIVFVKYAGAGRHYLAVSPQEFVLWMKLIFVEEFLYIISATLPKLTILALYMRLFARNKKPYYIAIYTIAVMMILNVIIDIGLALGICKPIAFQWDPTIPGGVCGNRLGAYRWISLPNVVTDILILLLPMPVVWNLHVRRANKFGLTMTFLAGSIGIITSVLRFVTFFTIDLYADPTFNVIDTMTWTGAEPGVYFIAACLPSLRPLLRITLQFVNKSTLAERLRTFITTDSRSRGPNLDGTDELKAQSYKTISSSDKYDTAGIVRETCIQVTRESDDEIQMRNMGPCQPGYIDT